MGSLYLSDFNCPNPDFQKNQQDSFDWLTQAYTRYQRSQSSTRENYERLLKRVGVSPSQIESRGYFLADFHAPLQEAEVFAETQALGMSARQKKFLQVTQNIFNKLFESRKIPEHLLHVTCTGYVSPSAAQLLCAEKSPQTCVTHAYHMGCYGAFPALRIARGFVRSEESAEVDIVHTELCTLHLNPVDPSLEQMVVQTLFADGVAAYRMSSRQPEMGLELLQLGEFLIPHSDQAMSWDLSEAGFRMTLSKDVPQIIGENLRSCLENWEKQTGVLVRALLKDAIVAVHPGGPKIIDFVQEKLELREEQVRFSRQVLKEHGNMSSATVPHIWNEILKDSSVPAGTPVISMAFGPGLTVSLSLMKVQR